MEIFRLFGTILVESDADEALENVDEKGERAQSRLGEISKAAGALVLGLAAVGAAAVLALGVNSVQVADEFRQAMNGLAAETGLTAEEMKEYDEITKRIYNRNLGENFEDIAKSLAKVKQLTGQSGTELESLTANALMLRDAFGFEVEGSIQSVHILMQKFKISADEAYTLIAQGAQQGANANGDLTEVLAEFAPHFAALGFSAEQFTDILIQGAKDGSFQVALVGDAIKEFTILSKDASDSTKEAFTSLGLDAQSMMNAFAGGGEQAQIAFQLVMSGLSGLEDPIARNQIGIALFGGKFEDLEAAGIMALGNVQSYTDSTASTLEDINKIKYDSFSQAIKGIGRMFETGVMIPIGEKILPKLSEFAEWFTSKMPQIEAVTLAVVDMVIAGFTLLADAIQWVVDKADILLPVLGYIATALVAQMIINTIVSIYGKWRVATTAMTTAQWLLNLAMSANPIGLVAAAIALLIAAGVALYMNWDKVSSFLLETWTGIKEAAMGIWNGLTDFFKEWGPSLFMVLTGPIGLTAGLIMKYWDEIKAFTLNVWGAILSFFTNDVPDAFNQFVTFFSELPGKIIGFLNDLFLVKIPYAVGFVIGYMITAVSEGIPKVIQFFADLPAKVWTWLLQLIANVQQWRDQMIAQAIQLGTAFVTNVISFFAQLPSKVWTWLVNAFNRIVEWHKNAATQAAAAGKAIIDAIIQFISQLPSTIANWFMGVITAIVSFAKNAYEVASNIGKNILNGIVDFVKSIPAKIEEFVGGIVGRIKEIAGNVKDAITGIFKSGSDGIQAGVKASGSTATITIPAHADGTQFAPGGLSLVGERGPELVNMPRGSQVFNAQDTKDMLGGASAQEIVIHNYTVMDGRVIAESVSRHQNSALTTRSRGLGFA